MKLLFPVSLCLSATTSFTLTRNSNICLQQKQCNNPKRSVLFSSAPSDVEEVNSDDDDNTAAVAMSGTVDGDNDDAIAATRSDAPELNPERNAVKNKLLQLCASYDRGFGASPKARDQVQVLVKELEAMNPTPSNAADGVDVSDGILSAPLAGNWRMVWTTALDVLSLGVSPIATPGAIYQVIEPPMATNIIDFIPRVQSVLPLSFPQSLVRAEVSTRCSTRTSQSTNRVGLVFEGVKLSPVQVLGMDTADMLPSLSIPLPTQFININDLPGVDPENTPGYFDVTYLDSDMLIIRQNEPGGYFVSIKADDCLP